MIPVIMMVTRMTKMTRMRTTTRPNNYVDDHETGTVAADEDDDEEGDEEDDKLRLRGRQFLGPRGRRRRSLIN